MLEENLDKYNLFYEKVIQENDNQNLTSIIDKEEFFLKHIKDSLLGIDIINMGNNVLDIGAGAGLPSIPLAINLPRINFDVIECSHKKALFLNDLIECLNLKNVHVINTRIEDYKKKEYYDFVISRAVAKLVTLVEYSLPFVRFGGCMVAYKSNKIDEELQIAKNAIFKLGGEVETIINKKLTEEIERSFVMIKKVSILNNDKYPRGGNKPRLKPLY